MKVAFVTAGALLLALGPVVTLAAGEDRVLLRNGDRISGEIERIWDGELIIDTPYADDVAIDLDAIVQIESAQEFEIELLDRSKLTGRIVLNENGEQQFESARQRVVLAPQQIAELEQVDDGELSWMLRSDFSLSGSGGNSDTRALMWQAAGDVEFDEQRHQATARIDRVEQDGRATRDQTRASYLYSLFLTDQWFLAGGIGYERDPERDLDYRVMPGLGVGYQFYEDADRLLEVDVSMVGIRESLAENTEESLSARWQLRYQRELFDGDIEFYHEHRIWSYLTGRDNNAVETVTGFRWDVWNDVYLNAQFDWDWESDPAQGADKTDTRYLIGFGLELD